PVSSGRLNPPPTRSSILRRDPSSKPARYTSRRREACQYTPSGYTEDMSASETRLDLEGMHCASCASSIERRLNELEGVEAPVNLAPGQATVRSDPGVPVDELVAAVESAGYGARPARSAFDGGGHHHHEEPLGPLQRRLIVAALLTVPVALLSMV